MVGALLSFSAMAVSIRELSNIGFTIFEILTVRGGGMLIILIMLMVLRPELRKHARPRRMKLRRLAAGEWRGAFPAEAVGLQVDATGNAQVELPAQSVRVLVNAPGASR